MYYRSLFLSLLLSCSLLTFSHEFINTQVTVELVQKNELVDVKALFIRTFKEAYKDIPLEVLKVDNLDSFLEAAFEDEPNDLEKPNVFGVVAKENDTIVGFMSFEKTNQEGEVYIRQLAVDPSHQKQGIGAKLVSVITEKLPSTTKLSVATRRVNKPAYTFYIEKLGFKECTETPHNLNPERYAGFEKEFKN